MSALSTELKYFSFFVLVAVACGQNVSDLGPTRYDMIHYLLDENRYDPSLPPDFYTENITTVSVEVYIADLNFESDIAMEYECTLYLRMNWTDNRLDYTKNRTSFDIIDLGDTIVDKVWVPDLYFHNARKSEMHGLFAKNQLLYIYRNGSVLYSSRFNIKFHCQMNLSLYPFDEQECPIAIQSYSLSKDYLILKWNKGAAVRIDDEVKDLKTKNESMRHSFHSPYSNPVAIFSTLTATLLFPRPIPLRIRYIVPAVLFSGLSLFCFILGNEVSTRVNITVGALIQIVLLWTGIYTKLPVTPKVLMLEVWMLGHLVFIAIVFVVNAVICRGIGKKKEVEQKKMDKESKKEDRAEKEETIPKQLETTQRRPNAESSSANEYTLLKDTQQEEYRSMEETATTSTNQIAMTIRTEQTETELKEDFLQLLKDNTRITTSTEWSSAKVILKGDPRYTRASENGQVEQWYKGYIDENAKEDFRALLDEKARDSKTWSRASMMIDHDPRYKTASEEMRQQVFEEYRNQKDQLASVRSCPKKTKDKCSCSISCIFLITLTGMLTGFLIVMNKIWWKLI